MGFLPDIPPRPSTPADAPPDAVLQRDMPPPIAELSREKWLKNPATINLERRSAPAGRHHARGLPGSAAPEGAAARQAPDSPDMHDALVFTRTKHRANRLAKYLANRIKVERITATGSQSPAHRGARGLQEGKISGCSSRPTLRRGASTVTALGHVVNFDVPHVRRLHPSSRPDRARRTDRRRIHAGVG